MFRVNAALFDQLVETVYAALGEAQEQDNWAHLNESEREQFAALVYFHLHRLAQGIITEDVVINPLVKTVYRTVERLLGREWSVMIGQGVAIDPASDGVMRRVEALRQPAPATIERNGDNELQTGVPASEGAARRPSGRK